MKVDRRPKPFDGQIAASGYCLVLQQAAHAQLFPSSLCGGEWQSIEVAPAEISSNGQDLYLDGDRLSVLPTGIPETVLVTILCRRPESLKKWESHADRIRIIFRPDSIAIFDAERNGRSIIVAKRDLKNGDILGNDDLEFVHGLDGLGVDQLPLITGMRLTQDVATGGTIDFGSIS